MTTTKSPAAQAGSYRVGDLDLNRIGYGAMQLAGPGVFGPPRDRAAAIEVLRTAVELGVNHIDTADAYGPYITNEIIREALFPYGDHVHIVTKVGVVRDERGGWLPANSPQSLREQVHGNLRRLGLDMLDVVNLRTLTGVDGRGGAGKGIASRLNVLRDLEQSKRLDNGNPEPPAEISHALAGAWFRQGNLEEAEKENKNALRSRPDFGEAHSNLAVIYLMSGRIPESRAAVEKAEKSGFAVNPKLKEELDRRAAAQ